MFSDSGLGKIIDVEVAIIYFGKYGREYLTSAALLDEIFFMMCIHYKTEYKIHEHAYESV